MWVVRVFVCVDGILPIFVCVGCMCVRMCSWHFANICLCGLVVYTLAFCQYLFVWVVRVYVCVDGILPIFVCVGCVCVRMSSWHFANICLCGLYVCTDV